MCVGRTGNGGRKMKTLPYESLERDYGRIFLVAFNHVLLLFSGYVVSNSLPFSLNSTYYFDTRIFEVLHNLSLFPGAWVSVPLFSILRGSTESLSDFPMGCQQVGINAGYTLRKPLALDGLSEPHVSPSNYSSTSCLWPGMCWCLFPICIMRNTSGSQEGIFPPRK